MRELKDWPLEEWVLIKDCIYQQSFPCMDDNSIYVCCTRNINQELVRRDPVKYINVCSDCIGSSCKHKESRYKESK